jgi:hypothetical protein
MKISTADEIKAYSQMLEEELPEAILEVITQNPGISEAKLIGSVLKLFPTTFSVDQRLCIAILNWLRKNDDISYYGNQRYMALPPHAEVLTREGNLIIKLCGDRRFDREINASLKNQGIDLNTQKAKGTIFTDNNDVQEKEVGILRTLQGKIDREPIIRNCFSKLDIPIFSAEEIQEALPSISNLMAPASTAFNVIGPSSGIWQIYNPILIQTYRWEKTENWQSKGSGILHWKASDDWRGKMNERFFYHQGGENLAELSKTSALLWTFQKDLEAGHPREMYSAGQKIQVPNEIPDQHFMWLKRISPEWRELTGKDYLEFEPRNNIQDVIDILKKTLGLKQQTILLS